MCVCVCHCWHICCSFLVVLCVHTPGRVRTAVQLEVADPAAFVGLDAGRAAARRDVVRFMASLQAQGLLSFEVFGVGLTRGNLARLLVSAGTVALSVASWRARQ